VAEVFISYSQKNRELVAPIAARLAELGVDAWFDRKISAGESFGAVIRARLKEAKAVLVCWSPEAIESQWVDAEADYAREVGTYVPVFVAACALMPPFNRIHADDLSNWTRSANDPMWLKVVERIGKLLGRDGVSEAAEAFSKGDERALYDFARRFPDEPAARKIWLNAEARHRAEFGGRVDEARSAAAARAARVGAEAAELDARIEASVPAFEAWLVDERRAVASGPRPDPLALLKRYVPAEEKKLRDEVAALSSALAHAKGIEEELEATKAEAARLSEQLSEKSDELMRIHEEMARLSDVTEKLKASTQQTETAKAEVRRLAGELSNGATEQQRLKVEADKLAAARPLKPLYTATGAPENRAELQQSPDGRAGKAESPSPQSSVEQKGPESRIPISLRSLELKVHGLPRHFWRVGVVAGLIPVVGWFLFLLLLGELRSGDGNILIMFALYLFMSIIYGAITDKLWYRSRNLTFLLVAWLIFLPISYALLYISDKAASLDIPTEGILLLSSVATVSSGALCIFATILYHNNTGPNSLTK
jgi:TIR domain-containing protein